MSYNIHTVNRGLPRDHASAVIKAQHHISMEIKHTDHRNLKKEAKLLQKLVMIFLPCWQLQCKWTYKLVWKLAGFLFYQILWHIFKR